MRTRTIHPQYITDEKGNKISVVIPINEYRKIIEDLDEFEDVRLYDEAKESGEPSIPIDEAFKIIEAKRKSKK
jgi:hypothetical protein